MITKHEALDTLDRLEFFQGQRAGRELWFEKSSQLQDIDIACFVRDLSNLREYIQAADIASRAEWISVEERLPDIDPRGKGRYGGTRSVRVLCACKQRDGRTFVKEGYYEPCGNGNVFWRIPGSIDSVTHWMPLPEPPKMKGVSHD